MFSSSLCIPSLSFPLQKKYLGAGTDHEKVRSVLPHWKSFSGSVGYQCRRYVVAPPGDTGFHEDILPGIVK